MSKKKKREEIQPVIPKEEVDKNVISPEDVEDVISGDEKALSEQMERIKDLTKETSDYSQNKKDNSPIVPVAQPKQPIVDKGMIEKQEAQLLAQKKAEEEKLRQQQLAKKQKEIEDKKREQQALENKRQEEQETLKKQEEERKKQEQQNITSQQTNFSEPPQVSSNSTVVPQQNISTNNNQNVAPNNTLSPPPAVLEDDSNKNEKGGPSTFKRVMAAILFILLMAMVYFLPEITSYINDMRDKSKQEKITSGVMECKLKKGNKKLDINIAALFYFTNSQLYKMEYTTVHTGDKVDDKEDLEQLYDDCLTLKKEAGELDGVTISCSLNNGVNSNKQILDYEKLDLKEVTSAYTEAGGVYPAEFKKSEDIDKIESEMTANKYICSRK